MYYDPVSIFYTGVKLQDEQKLKFHELKILIFRNSINLSFQSSKSSFYNSFVASKCFFCNWRNLLRYFSIKMGGSYDSQNCSIIYSSTFRKSRTRRSTGNKLYNCLFTDFKIVNRLYFCDIDFCRRV